MQAHYLGYPGTTGASYVDYLIADETVAPASLDAEFTERLVRLPGCFWSPTNIWAPCLRSPEPPTAAGRQVRVRQFQPGVAHRRGSLGPDSILWLKKLNDIACGNLRAAAARAGVEPDRLGFAPDTPEKEAHIARLHLADLGLDTIGRYNGHTSTADALWAGVPVVTTASDCFPGRVAASLLAASGLQECIAPDAASYRSLAIAVATQRSRCEALRRTLAEARGHARFFRPRDIALALEQAYSEM